MANNIEIFQTVIDVLGYNNSPGLVTDKNASSEAKAFHFKKTQALLEVDAVYYVKDVPVIYFKSFSELSEQLITEFHKKAWNQGIAPLLFILLPDEIRIYSSYLAPVLKKNEISSDEALIVSSKALNNTQKLSKDLKNFARIEVDTGAIWRNYPRETSNDNRINQVLLHNLKELRKKLHSAGLKYEYIHSLIGRSILMLYLEERGALTTNFYKKYEKSYTNYYDLLSTKMRLYKGYEDLMGIFGEDLFPVIAEEKKAVTTKHLNILKDVLSSQADDWYFWAFSFKLIPAELICSIYEEFLYIEEKGKEIASYAPPALASIMLNQVMPYDSLKQPLKILDPACGSSIFLVEAYKRLVESWIYKNKEIKPDFQSLHKILQDYIFGFDFKNEALRFTAFGLFLKMMDYIDEIDLLKTPKLPSLIGKNLIESDFFDTQSALHKMKYDIIIGNPPWQSNYGDKAKDYLKKTKYPVGDKQISQVFLWHAADLISDNGSICMLMPSKGLLYNFNPKNIEFREKFFKTYNIKKIINLSLFSNLLFENSKFPASIIIYALDKQEGKEKSTVYYAPKPSNKSWEFSTLVVDSSDVKRLPKQQILKNQCVWKIGFVGTRRDFILVNHLDKNFPKIEYFCEDMNWKYGEGFQLGGGDKNVNKDMAEMLYIPAKSIYPFYVDKNELKKLNKDTFHRPRDFSLYKAPHTLVRGGQIYAAYIDYDAVFTHAVMSFASPDPADDKLLKLLAAYLNSSLVLYYLFMTSSTWCIERTDIHLAEYRTLPFTVPSNKNLLDEILRNYDEIALFVGQNLNDYLEKDQYYKLRENMDNTIFDIFGLDQSQRQLIIDANNYTIQYFQDYSKSVKSKKLPESIQKTDLDSLKTFAETFIDIISRHISKYNYKIVVKIFEGDLPLDVMSFDLVPSSEKCPAIRVVNSPDLQKTLLHKLDNIVLKQTGESIYTTKNLRVFEGTTFHLVKPSEKRFWNRTMALNDADKNVREILNGFEK